jgi:hypothetical protein
VRARKGRRGKRERERGWKRGREGGRGKGKERERERRVLLTIKKGLRGALVGSFHVSVCVCARAFVRVWLCERQGGCVCVLVCVCV